MKYLLLLLIIPCLSASECGNKKKESAAEQSTEVTKDSIPSCIRQIIDKGGKEEPSNAPMQVDEYIYKGKTVYLFGAPCCDQFNTLYDENCKAICAPSGGFTGRGDGKCPDFSDSAKLVKTIWKKEGK